jgi:ureidoglycolate dehydrogenase (NAD+)
MMVEILCVLLAGMPFDHQLSHLYDPPFDQPRQVSHLFLAMDLEAFGSAAAFRQNLSRLLEMVRQEPGQPIAPGDLEKASTVTRLASGIPLSEVERAFFTRLANL